MLMDENDTHVLEERVYKQTLHQSRCRHYRKLAGIGLPDLGRASPYCCPRWAFSLK
jgi:hypothetical protein